MKHILSSLLTALYFCGAALAAADAIPLQQSTASQTVSIGPFVDSTDGNTEKTALTIANTDVKLSKNGGSQVSKNSGSCPADANGWYTCTLDATDTNTAGRLRLEVHVSGALPVWRDYFVYPTANYAFLFTTAPGAANGALIAGNNAATTFTGAAASGATPATAGLTLVGGAASTTGGGTSAPGLQSTGGAGAASTNGAADGLKASGGGTTTVSGGNGVNFVATGSAKDLNATSTPLTPASVVGTVGGFSTATYPQLGIISHGTAQAASSTSLTFIASDPVKPGYSVLITGGTTGTGETATCASASGSGTGTPVCTVTAWSGGVTPTGTTTYLAFATAPTTGATDMWATTLPGSYTSGQAGYVVGHFLDAAISTRMATFTLPPNFSSMNIDSSGRFLLQPTQTGVTIPTVIALTNAPGDSSGTATLLSRVSSARAGYLDNLSVAPATATEMAKVPKSDSTVSWNATALAAINAQAAVALSDYDPPTRAEATSDVNSVLTVLGTPVGASLSVDVAAIKAALAAGIYSLGYINADGDHCEMVISATTPKLDTTCTVP